MTDLFEAETTTTTSLDLRRLQRAERRKARRRRAIIAISIGSVIVAIAASLGWGFLQSLKPETTSVEDFEGLGSGTVTVIIEPNDTGADIAKVLYEAGVIESEQAFFDGARDNPNYRNIAPGHYWINREMSASNAILSLLDSDTRDTVTLSVPEGKTLAFYYDRIADVTGASLAEVEAAAEDTDALGLPPEAEGKLEGWLFASTYEFNPGVHPKEVLVEMVDTTITMLDKYNVAPEDRLSVLTIASIIEREARLEVDRPQVSSVIHNRLEKDMPLEMDSTVKYIAPSEGVFTSPEDRAIDNPYNTYMNTGLPPGPIAGPGEAAIRAAVQPADTPYVYFVTVNLMTGETLYAEDYNAHLANVDVLRAWWAENGDE